MRLLRRRLFAVPAGKFAEGAKRKIGAAIKSIQENGGIVTDKNFETVMKGSKAYRSLNAKNSSKNSTNKKFQEVLGSEEVSNFKKYLEDAWDKGEGLASKYRKQVNEAYETYPSVDRLPGNKFKMMKRKKRRVVEAKIKEQHPNITVEEYERGGNRYDSDEKTVYLKSNNYSPYTLGHEVGHAADDLANTEVERRYLRKSKASRMMYDKVGDYKKKMGIGALSDLREIRKTKKGRKLYKKYRKASVESGRANIDHERSASNYAKSLLQKDTPRDIRTLGEKELDSCLSTYQASTALGSAR